MPYPSTPIDPAAARSVVRIRVRFAETDLMGIVHHAAYVGFLEVARVEWLRRRGVLYAEWAVLGLHLAVAELMLKYRAPARFDEELDVDTSLGELRAASLRFDYRVVRAGDATLCATASTLLACVDGQQGLRRIAPEMTEALLRREVP
jgi:acyl-CoA thioester hydrolase